MPRTRDPEHLEQNLGLFDFELSSAQLAALDQLRRGTGATMWDGACTETIDVYNPFFDAQAYERQIKAVNFAEGHRELSIDDLATCMMNGIAVPSGTGLH